MNAAQPVGPRLSAEYTISVGLLHNISLQISRLLVQAHHYPTTKTGSYKTPYSCVLLNNYIKTNTNDKINAAGLHNTQCVYTRYTDTLRYIRITTQVK
jgi:hypothetical protein